MGGIDPKKKQAKLGNTDRRARAGRDSCDLTFTVDLMGVRRDVMKNVLVGMNLGVSLVTIDSFVAAVCSTSNGQTVGALAAFPGIAKLIGCLKQGVLFVAHVNEATPTSCLVTVERVR